MFPPETLERLQDLAHHPRIRGSNIHLIGVASRVELVWQYVEDPHDIVRSTGWHSNIGAALHNAELQIRSKDN